MFEIREKGGEYGSKLYFDSCNGKWLMYSNVSCWCWFYLEYDRELGKVVHIRTL